MLGDGAPLNQEAFGDRVYYAIEVTYDHNDTKAFKIEENKIGWLRKTEYGYEVVQEKTMASMFEVNPKTLNYTNVGPWYNRVKSHRVLEVTEHFTREEKYV